MFAESLFIFRSRMFSLLGDVKGLIKLDKLCIDNNVFRLHYKVSGCLNISIFSSCRLILYIQAIRWWLILYLFYRSKLRDGNGFKMHASGNLHHPAHSLHSRHGKAIHGSATVKFSQTWFWFVCLCVDFNTWQRKMKFLHRRPNWLHCRRCCAFGCDGHLLLDPLHFYVIHQHFLVHLPFWRLRASCEANCQGDKQSGCRGWERCCSPRSCPSRWRPRKYQVIFILSFCFVFVLFCFVLFLFCGIPEKSLWSSEDLSVLLFLCNFDPWI